MSAIGFPRGDEGFRWDVNLSNRRIFLWLPALTSLRSARRVGHPDQACKVLAIVGEQP
jgi:hypothetical protein